MKISILFGKYYSFYFRNRYHINRCLSIQQKGIYKLILFAKILYLVRPIV